MKVLAKSGFALITIVHLFSFGQSFPTVFPRLSSHGGQLSSINTPDSTSSGTTPDNWHTEDTSAIIDDSTTTPITADSTTMPEIDSTSLSSAMDETTPALERVARAVTDGFSKNAAAADTPWWCDPCAGSTPVESDHPPPPTPPSTTTIDNARPKAAEELKPFLKRILAGVQKFQNKSKDLNRLQRGLPRHRIAREYGIPTEFPCPKDAEVVESIWTMLRSFGPHLEEIMKAETAYREMIVPDALEESLYDGLKHAIRYTHSCLCSLEILFSTPVHRDCPLANDANKRVSREPESGPRFKRDQVVIHYYRKFLKRALELLSRD